MNYKQLTSGERYQIKAYLKTGLKRLLANDHSSRQQPLNLDQKWNP